MHSENHKTAVLSVLSTVVGYIISYYLSCRYFSADADVINSALVWHEVNKYGLEVMAEWKPTVDNWYLAIYPIHFLTFWVLGDPTVLMLKLMSATQVTLCSLVAALIAYSITRNSLSFLLVIFFSALSYFAYANGYVSHLFSHNAINLYGLICVLIYVKSCHRSGATIVICLLSLVASVSDPWFVVSYLIPFFLYSIYTKIRGEYSEKWVNIGLYAVTLVIFFSQLIQKALHLPIAKFNFADVNMIFTNAKWFFLGSGRLTNIFFLENKSIYLISSFIVIFYSLWLAWRNRENSVNVLLALSLLGVSSSFILGLPEKMDYAARFLVNIVYIVPLLILINTDKKLIPASSVFFVLSFSSSIWSHTLHNGSRHDTDVKEQIAFMESHNLTFGYGAYWGARANVVTWMSGEKVIIRPMNVNKNTGMIDTNGRRAQVFDTWYTPHSGRTFIAVVPDPETCPQVSVCITGMKKQFGEPDKTINYRNMVFLVYEMMVTDKLGPRYPASFTEGIDFTRLGWPEFIREVKGLSGYEPWGRWSDAKVAPNVRLDFSSPLPQKFTLVLTARPFGPNVDHELIIKVGEQEQKIRMLNGVNQLHIPFDLLQKSVDFIEFVPLNPTSPQQLGISSDARLLGIGFIKLSIEAA